MLKSIVCPTCLQRVQVAFNSTDEAGSAVGTVPPHGEKGPGGVRKCAAIGTRVAYEHPEETKRRRRANVAEFLRKRMEELAELERQREEERRLELERHGMRRLRSYQTETMLGALLANPNLLRAAGGVGKRSFRNGRRPLPGSGWKHR